MYQTERSFHVAANSLRSLVIQRLMELAKSHMPGTSWCHLLLLVKRPLIVVTDYKVRTSIGKHLQTRSKAIKTAVNRYNAAAQKLKRPTITIKKVLDQSFLDDFHILCDSNTSIRDRPWANNDNRVLHDKYYKVKGARYELQILNVEIQRIYLWMKDEKSCYRNLVATLQSSSNHDLAYWVTRDLEELERKCTCINYWLTKCEALDGYTGTRHITTDVPVVENEQFEYTDDSDALFAQVDEMESVINRIARLG